MIESAERRRVGQFTVLNKGWHMIDIYPYQDSYAGIVSNMKLI
jgi:hypothetical protein